jgi:O-antigen/teichoic acid export membrane protein
LAKDNIRVQYSGLVVFAAKILSVATGMIFTLLITRNITKEQYGVWANIFDLAAWFTVLAGAVPFWTFRFVARRKKGATITGFYANLLIAIVSVLLYVSMVPLITSALSVPESCIVLYFVASLQIVELYLVYALEAYVRAVKPQSVGFGILIVEACKVLIAYILIVIFQQLLLGAMISLIAAISAQIIYYIKLALHDLRGKVQWTYVREWLKGSTIYIYNILGNQLVSFIFIILFIYGGQAARGNYMAAATIANIVAYSSFLSFALYPKMLAENSLKDVTSSLKMVLMFAIPMAAGAMAIPESFLIILNETYGEVWPVLVVLAIDSLLIVIYQFYGGVLFGVEKLDEEAKIPFKQLGKSPMFKVFTLAYIQSAITLPTAFFVLSNFALNQAVKAAVYVAIINMTVRFAMFLVVYTIVRKSVSVIIPWRSIAKYVFASAIMATILYVLPHPTKLILTLGTAAAGAIAYLSLLMVIDKETRTLALSIWQELESKVNKMRTRAHLR